MEHASTEAHLRVEVFADATCPFTHVGLKRVAAELAALDDDSHIDLVVRAWPLEWINGSVFGAELMPHKFEAVNTSLEEPEFGGFDAERWPTTTIAALNLVAEAYARDARTGLRASLAIRRALFDDGLDIGDPAVISTLAEEFGLAVPNAEPLESVLADVEEGKRRGVRGSPEFWVNGEAFFCPSLSISTDDEGHLLAAFDPDGLEQLVSRICA